jgi:WhiB family transcriptional regulator, redox-sensing transcriptional regulator
VLSLDEIRIEELWWHGEAACRDVDPEIFYPERGGSAQPAREVCAGCPVRQECLEYALNDPDAFYNGIWGGTASHERRRILASRRGARR